MQQDVAATFERFVEKKWQDALNIAGGASVLERGEREVQPQWGDPGQDRTHQQGDAGGDRSSERG